MNGVLSFFIWIVLMPLGLVISLFPRKVELWIGPCLGKTWFLFSKKRKKIAFENLKNCFPEKSEIELYQILSANFDHYGILILELSHLFSPIPGHYYRYCQKNSRIEGLENWKRANEKGNGVLFVSSHLGNWELMAARGALEGIPLTMVTKQLKPQWLHRKVESSRLSVGVKGAYEPRTLPVVMRMLRASESVGFVMDQYAGPPMGIAVEFFGVQVGTLAAVGTLADRTKARVVPVLTYREPKTGIVVVQIQPEVEVSEDVVVTTQVLATRIEGWVRQFPTQWLWTHRRFKNVRWPTSRFSIVTK